MSSVTINEALNLVVPLSDDRGHVYCPPLSREAFEQCWKLFARTWSVLESDDLGITTGSAVAALALKECAESGAANDMEKYHAVMAEIRRNTTFIGATSEGFTPVPLATAEKKGWLQEDDRYDVENIIVFFTVASALLPKKRQGRILHFLTLLRDVEASSLTVTQYLDSLRNSTKDDATGETVTV
ncbi:MULTISPECIES: hypothetical protein [unclassified Saccharibacter]|uniref:hypothetical protein n=1 Tax=unclassified Saccharibacter TaxID=2648722 RepID=UPI00132CC094|nr:MULTISPECIES: hypothetical protein [unclassified Saccharibacter]MXV36817.1 hypothetical protein [Saccharibacter sp. EH611]MXV58693.1 hypothetical protein [Saccharibacter sp. EH70]MXV66199.1 hypothetical protein [Saccharibacter sp. EH60]